MTTTMEAEGSIRQGFLCPVCMLDLGDIAQLQQHVATEHTMVSATSSNDTHVKGLFERARARLRNLDSNTVIIGTPSSSDERSNAPEEQPNVVLNENQPIGLSTSHTHDFKHWREQQINDDEIETNQLIIRLDKLINQSPSDPVKRKAFEREVVPWRNDDDYPLCAFCRNHFTLMRRRHHCRTCGVVLCKECSVFVTFLVARKLINPAVAAGYDVPLTQGATDDAQSTSSDSTKSSELQQRVRRKADRLFTNAVTLLRKHTDTDALSIGSFVNQEGDSHLRVCPKCKQLLERRDAAMTMRQSPPVIVSFYERLHQLVDELSRVYPSYCRTADSINAGESMYTLDDAKAMKVKVIRLQEQIDAVSRKIHTYGVPSPGEESTENIAPPPQRQLLLQRNVRNYATTIVKDIILCMPHLPDSVTYEKLRAEYKRSLDRRIERERLAAAKTASLPTATSAPTIASNKAPTRATAADGWTADTKVLPRMFSDNSFDDVGEDPLQPLKEQIVIIRGTLRQAAEAGRLDEVQILERNLRELEEELDRQTRPGN